MKVLLRVLAACAAFCVLAAHAADATTVCGTPLTNPGNFAWSVYEKAAREPYLNTDVGTLRRMLADNSGAWDPGIRGQVEAALDEAWSPSPDPGRMGPAQFKIGPGARLTDPQQAFPTTAHAFPLPIPADAPECSTEAARTMRQQVGYFIELVQAAHAAAIQQGIQLSAVSIAAVEQQYDAYLFEGFPMFPWEAYLNGRFLTDDNLANGPPRKTLVLLHPSAGVVGAVSSGSSSDTGATLGVEALGMVWYTRNYQSWFGASLLAVFPTDRSAGYGVAFDYDQYKLGVVWVRQRSSSHHGVTLFLGMDLLQFVDKTHRKYASYKADLQDLIDRHARPPAALP